MTKDNEEIRKDNHMSDSTEVSNSSSAGFCTLGN